MGGFDHATTAHQHRTGRILSAHMAGNQPLNRQENPAETAYLHAITDTRIHMIDIAVLRGPITPREPTSQVPRPDKPRQPVRGPIPRLRGDTRGFQWRDLRPGTHHLRQQRNRHHTPAEQHRPTRTRAGHHPGCRRRLGGRSRGRGVQRARKGARTSSRGGRDIGTGRRGRRAPGGRSRRRTEIRGPPPTPTTPGLRSATAPHPRTPTPRTRPHNCRLPRIPRQPRHRRPRPRHPPALLGFGPPGPPRHQIRRAAPGHHVSRRQPRRPQIRLYLRFPDRRLDRRLISEHMNHHMGPTRIHHDPISPGRGGEGLRALGAVAVTRQHHRPAHRHPQRIRTPLPIGPGILPTHRGHQSQQPRLQKSPIIDGHRPEHTAHPRRIIGLTELDIAIARTAMHPTRGIRIMRTNRRINPLLQIPLRQHPRRRRHRRQISIHRRRHPRIGDQPGTPTHHRHHPLRHHPGTQQLPHPRQPVPQRRRHTHHRGRTTRTDPHRRPHLRGGRTEPVEHPPRIMSRLITRQQLPNHHRTHTRSHRLGPSSIGNQPRQHGLIRIGKTAPIRFEHTSHSIPR